MGLDPGSLAALAATKVAKAALVWLPNVEIHLMDWLIALFSVVKLHDTFR